MRASERGRRRTDDKKRLSASRPSPSSSSSDDDKDEANDDEGEAEVDVKSIDEDDEWTLLLLLLLPFKDKVTKPEGMRQGLRSKVELDSASSRVIAGIEGRIMGIMLDAILSGRTDKLKGNRGVRQQVSTGAKRRRERMAACSGGGGGGVVCREAERMRVSRCDKRDRGTWEQVKRK